MILPVADVSCLGMDTNRGLRLQALRLIQLGVTQKTIAHRMGMSEPRFSAWLRDTETIHPRLDALDGFRQFLADLRVEVTKDVSAESISELEARLAEHEAGKVVHDVSSGSKKPRAMSRRRYKGTRRAKG